VNFNPKKIITRDIKSNAARLDDEDLIETLYDEPIQAIKKCLRKKVFPFDDLFDELGFYGSYLATQGVDFVLSNEETGWDRIYSGWRCQLRELHLRLKRIESGDEPLEYLSEESSECAHILAGCVVFGEHSFIKYPISLLRCFSEKGISIPLKNDFLPYESFQLFMLAKYLEIPFKFKKSTKAQFKGYAKAVRDWDKPSKHAEILLAMADYHCKDMVDRDRMEEFLSSPYNLFPVEILCAIKLLNFTDELPEHPLLQLPTMKPPKSFTFRVEPSIQKGMQKLEEYLGV